MENPNNLRNNTFISNILTELRQNGSSPNNVQHKTSKTKVLNNGNNNMNITLSLPFCSPLIESKNVTQIALNELEQNVITNQQKVSTLKELSKTMNISNHQKKEIENELNESILQKQGGLFRIEVINEILKRIQKQHQKSQLNTNSLRDILNKMILSIEKAINLSKQQLNKINVNNTNLSQKLMNLCSDPNNSNLAEMDQLQSQKIENEKQEKKISFSITTKTAIGKGINCLINELFNNHSINYKIWSTINHPKESSISSPIPLSNPGSIPELSPLPLSPINKNHNFPTSTPTNYPSPSIPRPKAPKPQPPTIKVTIKPTIKAPKRKYQRPVRCKTWKKLTPIPISTFLPKTICPIRLSPGLTFPAFVMKNNEFESTP